MFWPICSWQIIISNTVTTLHSLQQVSYIQFLSYLKEQQKKTRIKQQIYREQLIWMWINHHPFQAVCMKRYMPPAWASVTAWKWMCFGAWYTWKKHLVSIHARHMQTSAWAYFWVRSISLRRYYSTLLLNHFNMFSADAAWLTPNCYLYRLQMGRISTHLNIEGFVLLFLQPPFTSNPTIVCLNDFHPTFCFLPLLNSAHSQRRLFLESSNTFDIQKKKKLITSRFKPDAGMDNSYAIISPLHPVSTS